MSTPWILLLMAALFEVGWAIGLKYAHGFTRLWPSVWTGLSIGFGIQLATDWRTTGTPAVRMKRSS